MDLYDDDENEDQQFVDYIFIKDDLRRRGFGRELVGYIEDETRKKGISIISVDAKDNEFDQFWTALNYRYQSEVYEYYKIITPQKSNC